MATAVQKITLSSSRDIPFNKLVLSQSNVRRVKAGVSIEELAEDIARRTLLQEPQRPAGSRRRGRRDRHVRGPGRRPALPGARASGQAEAPRQDRAGALRRARSQRRHLRRGGFAGRECPARAAASARPVPRLPGTAREGPVRGRDRRRLLRRRERGEAAAAPRRRVARSCSTSMPKTACRSTSSWRSRSRPITRVRSRSGKRFSAPTAKEPYQIRRMLTETHRARLGQARPVRRPRRL